MNKKTTILFITISLLCAIGSVSADSIWAKKDTNAKDMYSDDVARKIGDVLTISISEVSNMTNTSDRDMSKKTARDQNFDGEISIGGVIDSIPEVKFGSGTEYTNVFESEAKNKNQRTFVDNVTVVVIDIMPNGNLIVSGTTTRNISDDIQEIEVSGIVRPSDINYSNTVSSKRIANFNIITKYKGVSAPYNKPGWLGRILDFIWPF